MEYGGQEVLCKLNSYSRDESSSFDWSINSIIKTCVQVDKSNTSNKKYPPPCQITEFLSFKLEEVVILKG